MQRKCDATPPAFPPGSNPLGIEQESRAIVSGMPEPTRDPQQHPPSFAEAWDLWLDYRRHGARPLRDSTLHDYCSIYRRYLEPALGTVSLDAIDGARLARLTIACSASGMSPKRLSNVFVPLRACLRWHHRIGTVARDPAPWFEGSVPGSSERVILNPAQIEALLAELPAFYRPYVEFAAYMGTRAGEQRALTWDDVDLLEACVYVTKTYYRRVPQLSTKTGRGRVVPLPPHIASMLATWRDVCPVSPPGLVFPSRTGTVFDLDTFRARVFKPAVIRAGLPRHLRIHDLRHTAASLYLSSGATVREVMEIFGWTQIQTAQRYLHATRSLNDAAASLSRDRARALAQTEERPGQDFGQTTFKDG